MTIQLLQETIDTRKALLTHPIYRELTTPDKVRILMKHHVFAVWDFMCLLKKLQQLVTCVEVPWLPPANPSYARFINEIVIGEESDEDGKGGFGSHFELYIDAMNQSGADTAPIDDFLSRLSHAEDPLEALQKVAIPDSVKAFVSFNLQLVLSGKPHAIAAAFFYGREDLIPDMFSILLDELQASGTDHDRLHFYLQRHIELDGDQHGPLAENLLTSLCENDPDKQKEANQIAQEALEARIKLWDGVLEEIRANEKQAPLIQE